LVGESEGVLAAGRNRLLRVFEVVEPGLEGLDLQVGVPEVNLEKCLLT